ncbi:MAG: acyltransferase family protein [Lachnospiraceae bacterium]|nr:acyltransferase family protein [Lachnospiraceae bacterium]
MEKKRLPYFDIAKGAAMVLVLIGHLQGRILEYSPYIVYFCIWIFSFHMPFFFIVSGMLIKHRNDRDKDLKTLITKRFKGIMIPYYLFSAVYLVIVMYALFISKTILPKTLYISIWHVLSLHGMNVLWFLPAMFLGEILFLFILKKAKTRTAVIIQIVITMIAYILNVVMQGFSFDTPFLERVHELLLTLFRPVFASSFIAIGYYGYELFNRISDSGNRKKDIAVCLTLSQICLVIDIVCIIISMKYLHYDNIGDFRSLVQHNIFIYYICAISGSLWLLLMSKALSYGKVKYDILIYYGVNSLIFMAVHNNSAMLSVALNAAMYVNQFITRARGYVCYLIVIAVMLIYTTLMIVLIDRFFPFMAGKKRAKIRKSA